MLNISVRRCYNCGKRQPYTFWERLASKIAWHIFPNTLQEERNDAYLLGMEKWYQHGVEFGRATRISFDEKLINITNGN